MRNFTQSVAHYTITLQKNEEKKLTAASSLCIIVLIYARIFKFDPKTYAWHDSRPNKVLIQFIHANAAQTNREYQHLHLYTHAAKSFRFHWNEERKKNYQSETQSWVNFEFFLYSLGQRIVS